MFAYDYQPANPWRDGEREMIAEIINTAIQTKLTADDVLGLVVDFENRRVYAYFYQGEERTCFWFERDWFRYKIQAAVNTRKVVKLPVIPC